MTIPKVSTYKVKWTSAASSSFPWPSCSSHPFISSSVIVVHCCARWSQQHERLEKLNMQAIVSATTQGDEFIKEFFINHDKVQLVVQNMVLLSLF